MKKLISKELFMALRSVKNAEDANQFVSQWAHKFAENNGIGCEDYFVKLGAALRDLPTILPITKPVTIAEKNRSITSFDAPANN